MFFDHTRFCGDVLEMLRGGVNMHSKYLIRLLDETFSGFNEYVRSDDNLFDQDSIHGVFAALAHFVKENAVSEQQWKAMAALIGEIVGGRDANLDNAACTCFLENLASRDHPLGAFLTGEPLAYWKAWSDDLEVGGD